MVDMHLNYTARDYEDYRNEIFARIPSVCPVWTDWNENDIGVAIIEVFCGIAESLGFYLDNEAAEGYIKYTMQRKNMIELTRLIGYKFESLVAASTNVNFSLTTSGGLTVIIPKGTALSTSGRDPKAFVTIEESLIIPGETTAISYKLLDFLYEDTSATEFTITTGGNHTDKFVTGAYVKYTVTVGGVAGTYETTVVNSSYSAGETLVEVNLTPPLYFTWENDTSYIVGDLRSWAGITYECTVAHTSSASPATLITDIANWSAYVLPDVNSEIPANPNSLSAIWWSTGNVEVEQGSWATESHTHLGTTDFTIDLSSKAIAEGSVQIIIGGTYLEHKLTFLDSGSLEEHFTHEIDEDNQITIYFGDGINGKLYPAGTIISVNYVVTEGLTGNVGSSLIDTVVDVVYDSGLNAVSVDVDNITGAVGGRNAEDIERARIQAPAEIVSQDRCVTTGDFDAEIISIPGIAEARAYDIKDSSLIPFNVVRIYVIPDGGGLDVQTTSAQRTEIDDLLTEKALVGVIWEQYDVSYVNLDFDVDLYIYNSYNPVTVKGNVSDAITTYLSIESLRIGQTVRYADLALAIQGVDGVATMTITGISTDQTMPVGCMAQSGTINLTVLGSI